MHAGRVAAVLVRVSIDREVEEVSADPAIIEQGIALTWRAIASDALAIVLGGDENR